MVTRLTGRACARGAALTARARQNCSNSLYFPSLAEGVEGLSREVEVRLTPRTVEVFLKGERIAAHLRSSGNHRHTTVADHMPSSHRRYADWTVERIRHEAAAIGPATAGLCELILERRPHPEQGFRSCLGIVRLVRPFGAERLEAADQAPRPRRRIPCRYWSQLQRERGDNFSPRSLDFVCACRKHVLPALIHIGHSRDKRGRKGSSRCPRFINI
jgi:hypothetical protein